MYPEYTVHVFVYDIKHMWKHILDCLSTPEQPGYELA